MDGSKSFSISVQVFSFILLAVSSMLVSGCMSIHTAAEAGNVGCVRRWLALGISPNTRGKYGVILNVNFSIRKSLESARSEIV